MAVNPDALLRKIKQYAPDTKIGLRDLGVKNAPIPSTPRSTAPVGVTNPNALPKYKTTDDFAYDRTYSTQADMLKRQLADATSQYDLANQQDEEAYQRFVQLSQQQQGEDSSALMDRLANQGILRSGIQVKASSDLADTYARRQSEAERTKAESRTGRDTQFSNYKRGINDQLGLLKEERASREQERQEAIARRIAQQQPKVDSQGQYQPNAPGASDANAADDPVQKYLQALYDKEQQEKSSVQSYLDALYRAGR